MTKKDFRRPENDFAQILVQARRHDGFDFTQARKNRKWHCEALIRNGEQQYQRLISE